MDYVFDSHAHYFDRRFQTEYQGGAEALLADLMPEQVRYVINVGTDCSTSRLAIEQAARYEGMYAAVGIHPGDCHYLGDPDAALEELEALLGDSESRKRDKIVALGEIGLDYHFETYGEHPMDKGKEAYFFDRQMELAKKYGASIDRVKYKALVGEAMIGGKRALLMKPETFMNLSGDAVSEAMRFYKLAPSKLIVISDDISLDVGRLRVRRKGSAGGHNGLKSIEERMGSNEYPRIKVGVGEKPHPDYNLADWVLSNFTDMELERLMSASDTAILGIEKIIGGDVDGAMQICNKK